MSTPDLDTIREHRVHVELPGTDDETTLHVGDLLVRAHKTEIGSRVTALEPAPAKQGMRGPRGGQYLTRRAGTHVIVRCANGRALVLQRGCPAVVVR